jgi:hypothetical protein
MIKGKRMKADFATYICGVISFRLSQTLIGDNIIVFIMKKHLFRSYVIFTEFIDLLIDHTSYKLIHTDKQFNCSYFVPNLEAIYESNKSKTPDLITKWEMKEHLQWKNYYKPIP